MTHSIQKKIFLDLLSTNDRMLPAPARISLALDLLFVVLVIRLDMAD